MHDVNTNQEKEEGKPPNSSLFSSPCPYSPAGDLSKVQFPASLQTLNLHGGGLRPMRITGTFAASLDTI